MQSTNSEYGSPYLAMPLSLSSSCSRSTTEAASSSPLLLQTSFRSISECEAQLEEKEQENKSF